MHYFKIALFTCAIAYIALLAFALLAANSMVFPGKPERYDPPLPLTFIDGADGRIATLLSPPSQPNPKRQLLLYAYGNAENIAVALDRTQWFRERGFYTLLWDYPGYGQSDGKASETTVLSAADAVLRHATTTLGFAPDDIVLYGRSVGGGPTLHLAANTAVRAVILEVTFSSTFRVMTRIKIVPWDILDNLAAIPHAKAPLLILHGTSDYVVPFSHSRQLFNAAPQGKATYVVFEGGGHNNLPTDFTQQYTDALTAFLNANP